MSPTTLQGPLDHVSHMAQWESSLHSSRGLWEPAGVLDITQREPAFRPLSNPAGVAHATWDGSWGSDATAYLLPETRYFNLPHTTGFPETVFNFNCYSIQARHKHSDTSYGSSILLVSTMYYAFHIFLVGFSKMWGFFSLLLLQLFLLYALLKIT